jgi:hypothetical protein
MNKIIKILTHSIPILIMIVLIPLVQNDYTLTLLYVFIIFISLKIKKTKNDFLFFTVGLIGLTVSEYIFISTGVETFNRNSLFGLMPIWLPILWGYGFIVIKRSIETLNQ